MRRQMIMKFALLRILLNWSYYDT